MVMAKGRRAFDGRFAGIEGKLIPQKMPNQKVQVALLKQAHATRLDVDPRNILPKHPYRTPHPKSNSYVTFLKGSMKGQLHLLVRVEGGFAWVKERPGRVEALVEQEPTQHSRFELVLTNTPLAK